MENKKYLFICSSQYAVLNSVNAVLNNVEKCNGNADIVIFHRTNDMKSISEKLRESKIFGKVYDFTFINNMNVASLVMLFVFPMFFLSRLRLTDQSVYLMKGRYKVLFSQSPLYASLFRRMNENVEVYFIEDGLSSYTNHTIDPRRRSVYFRLVNKIFFRGSLLSEANKQLLYAPEMCSGDIGNIKKLPMCKPEDSVFYNRIFKYKDNPLYSSHKFIYLGVVYRGLKNLMSNPKDAGDDLEDKCKFIVDSAMKVICPHNFIYRKHPIENVDEDYYKEICKFDKCQNMWETECQNTITDNHALVSFFSTAAFTPKMLYGKEPYLIFLYKMLGAEFFNADELVNSLRSTYSDPQKVIAVENFDELFATIKKLDLLQEM